MFENLQVGDIKGGLGRFRLTAALDVLHDAAQDLGGFQILLGIMQDIERRSEAAPAEAISDAADEKLIEQLKVRLQDDKG